MASPSPGTLTKKQRRLLALRALNKESTPEAEKAALRARPRTGATSQFRLSFAQQRLWFLEKLDPESAAYNLSHGFTIDGQLDPGRMRDAFRMVFDRHEVLRTRFSETPDGTPVQVIQTNVALPFTVVDLRPIASNRCSGQDRIDEVRSRIEKTQARRPFDIEKDVPIRVVLVRLPDEKHRIILTMHHIASDGWSMQILANDFTRAYRALETQQTPTLPALEVQYADYAEWQRDTLGKDTLAPQVEYWKEVLADAPSMLALPTDRPRPPVQSFEGDWVSIRIPPALTRRLKDYVQSQGATPFMGLLAAFVSVLSRYARQRDVLLGTPVAGRTRRQIEDVIGFFVNTLVIRSELPPDASFQYVLNHVRERTLRAQSHQDVPFERIVDALDLERDLSRHPLFQVAFAFGGGALPGQASAQNPFGDAAEATENVAFSSGTSKFDLTLVIADNEDHYLALFEYSTALFDAATIEHMATSYRQMLDAALCAPTQSITTVPLVPSEETDEIIRVSQGASLLEPSPVALHALVEQQVRRTPDAVAVQTESGTFTYRTLNRCSNALGMKLKAEGVGRDSRVGICAERSHLMTLSILGVLKAGAAYVPFDPDYPEERLAYMAENSNIDVMLVQDEVAEVLPPIDVPCVSLDGLSVRSFTRDASFDQNLPSSTHPDDLAYVVYTSGSSGRPKGVMVTHRGIVNEIRWRQSTLPLQRDDEMLHNFSFSFDPSIWMIFWPLMAGASIFIVPPGHLGHLSYLIRVMQSRRPTLFGFAPSMLDALLSLPGMNSCTALRHLFSGGEALPGKLAGDVATALPRATLHNMYGLTEVAIDATHHVCSAHEERPIVSVGAPISNEAVYLLDGQRQLLPSGMPGELYIGGVGIGRGYQGRPRLTAERFGPDPFTSETGGRMYRTGDLGRRLSNAEIDFLGRVDRQIKLRGYRIEPSTVEAALLKHDAVAETAVRLVSMDGRDQLVAYFSVEDGLTAPNAPALQQFLKAAIPEFMIPSRFVMLEAIPHTPNDKVDYDALPKPSKERTTTEGAYVGPRSSVEETLCSVWKQVLGLSRVGVEDNFFTIGGDSILSIQIVAQARRRNVVLTPQQMFQHQTVAALAQVAETGASVNAEQGIVSGATTLLPSQREWMTRAGSQRNHWNRSGFFETDVAPTPSVLHSIATALLAQHDALRSRFSKTETDWSARITPHIASPACCVNISGLPTALHSAVLQRLVAEAQNSLDLTSGPLFRLISVDRGADCSGRLLVIAHRSIVDDVSWEILLEDLHSLAGAAQEGASTWKALRKALPPKTTSIQDWGRTVKARAESDHASGAEEDGSYWIDRSTTKVRAVPGMSAIDQNENQIRTTARRTRHLDARRTRTLTEIVPRDNRTRVTDVLLAALAQALHTWGEREATWVDVPGYGRTVNGTADLTRTVGRIAAASPVLIPALSGADKRTAIRTTFANVRDELRAAPEDGAAYARLRYGVGGVPPAQPDLPDAALSFRYQGRMDRGNDAPEGFGPAPEGRGDERAPDALRSYVLAFQTGVVDSQLRIECEYSTALHMPDDIEALLDAFLEALDAMTDYVLSSEVESYHPDDFALADLSKDDLSTIGHLLDAAESS